MEAAFEMSSDREENELEQREDNLRNITDKRKELSKTIESLDWTIQEAKVAYLGTRDNNAKTKIMNEIRDLEDKLKENRLQLKELEKKVEQVAVDFLNIFSN
jgi:seryl-tRNA synthetase